MKVALITIMKAKPYAKFKIIEKEFKIQRHLVNPTANKYIRVVMETGTHAFFDDELVATNTVTKEFGELEQTVHYRFANATWANAILPSGTTLICIRVKRKIRRG